MSGERDQNASKAKVLHSKARWRETESGKSQNAGKIEHATGAASDTEPLREPGSLSTIHAQNCKRYVCAGLPQSLGMSSGIRPQKWELMPFAGKVIIPG